MEKVMATAMLRVVLLVMPWVQAQELQQPAFAHEPRCQHCSALSLWCWLWCWLWCLLLLSLLLWLPTVQQPLGAAFAGECNLLVGLELSCLDCRGLLGGLRRRLEPPESSFVAHHRVG